MIVEEKLLIKINLTFLLHTFLKMIPATDIVLPITPEDELHQLHRGIVSLHRLQNSKGMSMTNGEGGTLTSSAPGN